ncbi:MAG: DEAD/DEAH box helicase [Rhodobacteraceae bacterium]|nr:DEAD/DEAH box helicase [Paracoccaceae bacterium]
MINSLSEALAQRGYETLTEVQQAVTAPEHESADLLVSAQTGSGKTVGFGLAIAPTILEGDTFGPAATPLALVIAPTRELALQVKRELQWLYAGAGARMASCVGGMDMREERRTLSRGAHIVVATPGRLRDHIMRGSIDLRDIRAVVLDEADEMLDLGFREDLEFILEAAPENRRTLMFSATVPKMIANLARNYQRDAVRISTKDERKQHADIEYRALNVAPRDGENAIINLLRFYEAKNALVFCNTRAMVNRLTTRFSNRGFSVVALSGELSQNERSHALQAMRDGRARVCVATDVAARGIDLPNLELVIHADLPSNSETLLHRSGRTGRAGRKGVSALIVPPKARRKAERLLGGAKVKAEWSAAPAAADVRARDDLRLMENPSWNEAVDDSERETVDALIARFSPEQLAVAFLRVYSEGQSAPEELGDAGAAPAPRGKFGPGVWFSINVGRKDNAEARWLLPMLCRSGDINKDDIGAIRIQPAETFVEILKTSVDGFLQTIGTKMLLEAGVKITLLDKAPDLGRPDSNYKGKRKPRHEEREPRRDDAKYKRKPRNESPASQEDAPKGKKKSNYAEAIPSKKKPKKPSAKNKGKRRKPST